MIANFFYGVGSMLIFAMGTTMLTEFMPQRASSGVALNNFFRNIFSCVGGIVAAPIIAGIGDGWLFTILGIWALSSASVIWAMRSMLLGCLPFESTLTETLEFGPKWRIKMEEDLG
jgi:MFS family permease